MRYLFSADNILDFSEIRFILDYMNWYCAGKISEMTAMFRPVLAAAVVFCALFSVFSPSTNGAVITDITDRAEKFLASHSNKVEAQKIIYRGFAKLHYALKNGDKQKIETVMNLAVADYWKIRKHSPQLHRNTPGEQHPVLTAGTGSGSNAVVPSTQRDVLNMLAVQHELPFEPLLFVRETSSPVNNSVIVPQRNLPLVI
jgi:hypothetical protein